jgi:Homeodomain-like domain
MQALPVEAGECAVLPELIVARARQPQGYVARRNLSGTAAALQGFSTAALFSVSGFAPASGGQKGRVSVRASKPDARDVRGECRAIERRLLPAWSDRFRLWKEIWAIAHAGPTDVKRLVDGLQCPLRRPKSARYVAHKRIQMVLLRESGMTQPAIAETMGVSSSTVNRAHMVCDGWRDQGAHGEADRRPPTREHDAERAKSPAPGPPGPRDVVHPRSH